MKRRANRYSMMGAVLVGALVGATGSALIGGAPSRVTAARPSALALATAGFGTMQAATHGAGHTKPQIVPFIHTQRVGYSGPAVAELQRALVRAGARPASARPTGHYGAITGREVSAFQRRVKLAPSGVYGYPTHLKLSRYYTAPSRGRLQQVAHSRKVVGYRNAIRHAAAVAWQHRSSMAYSQSASRGFLPSLPNVPLGVDCSAYVTWIYKVSGLPTSGLVHDLPDPNGFGYRIVGYTGTLAEHGVKVPANGALHVGDLVFYGGGWPYGHVTIVVDAIRRLVSGHGRAGVDVTPFNFEHVSAIRRYF